MPVSTVPMRQKQYARHAILHAPKTFLRRVLFGRDAYWRQYFWSRWGWVPRGPSGRSVWIDALSGGEVTQLASFCAELRRQAPNVALVLATFNVDGFHYAKTRLDVDHVIDSPWDVPVAVRRALSRIRPWRVVFIQEVANAVVAQEARRLGIETVLVSGLMRGGMERHEMVARALELGVHASLTRIGARTEEDAAGFLRLGAPASAISVTGDLRFEQAILRDQTQRIDRLRAELRLLADRPILVVGSIHEREYPVVAEAIARVLREEPNLSSVVAPRDLAAVPRLEAQLHGAGLRSRRRTGATDGRTDANVVVLDTFGELALAYHLGSVTFIGGSLFRRKGVGFGQSIAEPLVAGKPVLFGPYMSQWRSEVEALRAAYPGAEVSDAGSFAAAVLSILRSPALADALRVTAAALVRRHSSASRRNADLVLRPGNGTEQKERRRVWTSGDMSSQSDG